MHNQELTFCFFMYCLSVLDPVVVRETHSAATWVISSKIYSHDRLILSSDEVFTLQQY